MYWVLEDKFLKFKIMTFNPIALRKAKIIYNVGLSECNMFKFREIFSSCNFSEMIINFERK